MRIRKYKKKKQAYGRKRDLVHKLLKENPQMKTWDLAAQVGCSYNYAVVLRSALGLNLPIGRPQKKELPEETPPT